ncbi:unnamed protein product, partial [Ranitomeya imitator]
MLLGVDPAEDRTQPLPTSHPQVTYSYMKYVWKKSRKDPRDKQNEVYQDLLRFVNNMQIQAQRVTDDPLQSQEMQKLMARCFLKLGEWQVNLQGINENTIPLVMQYVGAATEHDLKWYKAWHAWAVMNFEAVLYFRHHYSPNDETKVRHLSTGSNNIE